MEGGDIGWNGQEGACWGLKLFRTLVWSVVTWYAPAKEKCTEGYT